MQILSPTLLLGGLSPTQFMRRHWQKKPLLIRQAVTAGPPLLTRAELFALAARDEVESRLIVHDMQDASRWSMRQGPLARRALPPIGRPGWTLLVQGVDLHVQSAHKLLSQFRFVPDARVDDLMVSWASDGGGVGPHLDSYDVFLLQLQGRRRWRIGPPRDTRLQPDVPLRILQHFEPDEEWLLEPGDMLYLPPRWAHDGVAEGECMTASIGFRAASRDNIARDLLQRLLDHAESPPVSALYRDPKQEATDTPGRIPSALNQFAADAVVDWLRDPTELARALGEALSEPKPQVWFESNDDALQIEAGVRLDRRTRMVYDDRHVFINGESFRAGGRDAKLMHGLADMRSLSAKQIARLSPDARELLGEWHQSGWLHAGDSQEDVP